ncbi:MAG: zinc-ribbon domain-containing protein [Bacilli bacterium]|nr:zinc-ribbon domain-containing protein [Bacilli bacterium]
MKYCTNCGNLIKDEELFCTNCGKNLTDHINDNLNEQKTVESSRDITEKSKKYLLISFLLTLIPVILFAYCYISAGGDFSGGGKGVVIILFIVYCFTIGVPVAIASTCLGIMSLKIKRTIFSIILFIIDTIINLVPILIMLLFFYINGFFRI